MYKSKGPRRSFGRQSRFSGGSSRGFSGRRGGGGYGRSFGRKPKTFDPSMFIKQASTVAEEVYEAQHKFADFQIHPKLKANIERKGYTIPTPIQDQAIPQILAGKDVVGIANTGTGKTAAFLIPIINKFLVNPNKPAVVITPTRELALQIQDEFLSLVGGLGLYTTLCIGGVPIGKQINQLKRFSHLIVGTPGRLKDLENRGFLRFDMFDTVVLDEVDRMLDMGFINDIRHLINMLPQERQSLFFSATTSDKVDQVMRVFLQDPVKVSVKTRESAANVEQDIVKIAGRSKVEVLHDLLIQQELEKVLVFGRTKFGIEKLAKQLFDRGFNVGTIHGNKNQSQRQRALLRFRRDQIQVLVATDVASRGLDIKGVTHVINFDLPESYEDHIHRIGRTGRADRKGVALTFVD